MNALTVVTAAADTVVSLDDVKQQSRIDVTTDDAYISEFLIPAAEETVEAYLRRPLLVRTYKLTMDGWPAGDRLTLPKPPLISVSSVVYYDEDGASATYASSNYIVDTASQPGRLVLKSGSSWPSTVLQEINGVEITFTAGYATVPDIPLRARQAVLVLAATLYEHRESIVAAPGIAIAELPLVQHLLYPLRDLRF